MNDLPDKQDCTQSAHLLPFDRDVESSGRKQNLMARKRFQKGNLYDAGKTWRLRYMDDVIQGDGTVKRVYRNNLAVLKTEYPTRRLALRWAAEALAEVNSTAYKPKHVITFAEFAEKWKTNVMPNHKPSTQSVEKHQVARLTECFGGLPLSELSTETLQRWITLQRNSGSKTIRNYVATLRMMWNSAKAWGYVSGNPFEMLILPARGLVNKPSISPDHAREVIRRTPEPFKTMFWIVAETGMRGGEVVALPINLEELDSGLISVCQSSWCSKLQTPKTNTAVRRFPISVNLAIHIRTYLGNRTSGLVFDNHGRPYSNYSVVQHVLRPILTEMGIYQHRMGLHSFRRGSCSVMDSLAVPAKVRMERVGHSSFDTTLGYTHSFSEDHLKIARKLGQMFDPKENALAMGAD